MMCGHFQKGNFKKLAKGYDNDSDVLNTRHVFVSVVYINYILFPYYCIFKEDIFKFTSNRKKLII